MGKDRDPEPIPTPPYDIEDLFPDQPLPTPRNPLAIDKPKGGPGTQKQPVSTNVDRGAFTQLISAAQQCGLTVNIDAIIEARDRELRAGRYQKAFDMIEQIYVQINAQITRRQEDLRRLEFQFRSGELKMSPKEWLMLQRREMEKTQKIDRARRHFARVLDGLTVLRASASK